MLNICQTHVATSRQRDVFIVFNDHITTMTVTKLIVTVLTLVLRFMQRKPDLWSTYHLAADGETSLYKNAKFVLSSTRDLDVKLGIQQKLNTDIPTTTSPTTTRKLLNSRVDTCRLSVAFGLILRNW